MRTIATLLFLLAAFFVLGQEPSVHAGQPYEVNKIWGEAPHSAFTDLIRFDNTFYCTFREASGHMSGNGASNGVIRIIASEDGDNWYSVALLEKEGLDLRDSKLSITPEGKLMVLMGATLWEGSAQVQRLPHVSFLNPRNGRFSKPEPAKIDKSIKTNYDWIWRVTWNQKDKKGYGVVYSRENNEAGTTHLVSTKDGTRYKAVSLLRTENLPGESSIVFNQDGEARLVMRNDSKKNDDGLIGKSAYPYIRWEWVSLGIPLGGPEMIALDDNRYIIGTRAFPDNKGTTTALFLYDDQTNKCSKLIDFPSKGDTSYPGMLIHEGKLWVSYYSSHEGKSQIYLAKIPLDYIETLVR